MNLSQFRKKIEEIVALKNIMFSLSFDKTKECTANFLVQEKEKQFGYSEKQRQFVCGVKLKDFENALKTELGKKGFDCYIELGDCFPMEMEAYLTVIKQNDKNKLVYNYDLTFNGRVYTELLCSYDFILPLEQMTENEHPDWIRLIKDFPEIKEVMWKLIADKNNQLKQNHMTLIQQKIEQNLLKQKQLTDPEYIQGEISHLTKENKLLEDKKAKISNQINDDDLDEIAKVTSLEDF